MNNSQIKQFDSIIKNASANFELPFNEDAWSLMDKKLDKELGNNKKRSFLYWFIPVAVLFAGIGIYTVTKNSAKNTLTLNKTNENVITKNKFIEPTKIENITPNTAEKSENKNENNLSKNTKNSVTNNTTNLTQKSEKINNTIENKKLIITKNNLNKGTELVVNNVVNIKKNDASIVAKNNTNAIIDIPKNASNTVEKNNSFNTPSTSIKTLETIDNINTLEKNVNKITANYAANKMHNKYTPNYKYLESISNKIAKPDLSVYTSSSIELLSIYKEIPLLNRWYISVAIANNISYAGNPRIADSKLGFKFNIGYNLNNQLSFYTGLGFGNKNFDMRTDQYVFTGTPIWQKYIRTTNANINVIELPIAARYQFAEKPNTGLFCTFGFSTLFFTKDNYTLGLDLNSTGVLDYKSWDFDKSNTELTILNLSIGYQYPLSKYFTLTAEQYLQLPTKNIGGANSRMSSTGLQVGLKYNFIKGKK